MLNEEFITSIFAITLMIMTVLMLGYHVTHFISKQQAKNSENHTVIDRLNLTGPDVVVLGPSMKPENSLSSYAFLRIGSSSVAP
jgi:hypothetical protein